LVDTLSVLYTEPLIAEDVIEDIDTELQLVFSNKLLSSRETLIGVHLDVERFTQINKVIPIQLRNFPNGSSLSLKPSEVELSFWIAMQDVDKVSDSDFYIYCDYNEVLKTKSSVLNVFIDDAKYPSIVKRVKYSPTTIEFVDY
jgi:5,10-methenyltetrahydromethanopterin hydrogenase